MDSVILWQLDPFFCPPKRGEKETEAEIRKEKERGYKRDLKGLNNYTSPLSMCCHPLGSVKCRPPY